MLLPDFSVGEEEEDPLALDLDLSNRREIGRLPAGDPVILGYLVGSDALAAVCFHGSILSCVGR
jgi:hypothetical protein